MQKLFHFVILSLIFLSLVAGCKGPDIAQFPDHQPKITLKASYPATEIPTDTPIPSLTPEQPAVASPSPVPTEDPKTIIAFTGVIVPARCVQAGIDERGTADYLYSNVRHILETADVTVGVYNATIRSGVPYTGCVNSWELIGAPKNADALKDAGFDLMSLATNHIKDCGSLSCGDAGFFETLQSFERVGIKTVGAGENLFDALEPVFMEVNGVRFGFVSLGEVNERVFAGDTTPGIAYLTRRNLKSAIESARSKADVVIVLPHSGPEDYPEVTPQQKYWARHAVEYGADLVVITHAHILQGYQYLGGVPVFYSLGNFVFDQVWARDHQQGAILLVTFEGDKLTGFEMIPTIVEQDGTVSVAFGDEKDDILSRLDKLNEELGSKD